MNNIADNLEFNPLFKKKSNPKLIKNLIDNISLNNNSENKPCLIEKSEFIKFNNANKDLKKKKSTKTIHNMTKKCNSGLDNSSKLLKSKSSKKLNDSFNKKKQLQKSKISSFKKVSRKKSLVNETLDYSEYFEEMQKIKSIREKSKSTKRKFKNPSFNSTKRSMNWNNEYDPEKKNSSRRKKKNTNKLLLLNQFTKDKYEISKNSNVSHSHMKSKKNKTILKNNSSLKTIKNEGNSNINNSIQQNNQSKQKEYHSNVNNIIADLDISVEHKKSANKQKLEDLKNQLKFQKSKPLSERVNRL